MTQNSCLPTSPPFVLKGRMILQNSGIALKLNLFSFRLRLIVYADDFQTTGVAMPVLFPSSIRK